MIDIAGLVKANSSSPASVSKPEVKDKDTRKVWDMTLEEIGYYLTLCDTDEKVMRFMSLLSPEQMKMIAEQGEKASEELAAEYFDTGTGDDEEFADPDEEPEPSEEELEEEAEDFFGSDDEDDLDEAEDTASDEPDAGSVEEEPDDEALFADSDEELSGDTSVDEVSDEALFTDTDEDEEFSDEDEEFSDEDEELSDEDEELSDEDEEFSDEKNIGSELSNPQPIAEAVQEESLAGTATQVIEPSEDISFFEGTDDDDSEDESFFSDDDEEYEEVFDDNSDVSGESDEVFNDDLDDDEEHEEVFDDNSDEDKEFEVTQTSVVPEPVKIQPSVVPEPVKIQPSVVPEPVKIQPSVVPEPVKIQPSVVTSTVQRTLVPKKKLTRGTTQEHTPVKIPQVPVDKAENPVRNPVGTSTRGYDVSNKTNLCGEKYQDGWSLIKYLQANRGNKKACSKEVVLHYYSLETIERGEDMGKFVISKGILRF